METPESSYNSSKKPLVRSFEFLEYVLYQWYTFGSSSENIGNVRQNGLPAISFDKLLTLIARLWEELYEATDGQKLLLVGSEISPDDEVVTFRIPMQERLGIHGRGMAIPKKDGSNLHLLQLLYDLRQKGAQEWFAFVYPDGAPEKPDDPRTHLRHGHPENLLKDPLLWLDKFSSFERRIIQEISNAVRLLSSEEIRALGTHENAEKTREDIVYEFERMVRPIEKIVKALSDNSDFRASANEFVVLADEAVRKSSLNRASYEAAREKVYGAAGNPLRDVIAKCKRPSTEIWDDQTINWLKLRASSIFPLSQYTQVVASLLTDPNRTTRVPARIESTLKKAADLCHDNGVTGLPGRVLDVLSQDSGLIKEECRKTLIAALNSSITLDPRVVHGDRK